MPAPTRTARRSAVLILFGEGPRGADVLLIEKAAHLRTHAGQPAFPGGGVDPGDDYPVGTALREAEEEAGIEPAGVRGLATPQELYLAPSDPLPLPRGRRGGGPPGGEGGGPPGGGPGGPPPPPAPPPPPPTG